MWLKEYIYNALLQPMHQVMYYILVGSAVSLAATNPIYGIIVLAFMSEAEKLLKKIFGFDKAGAGTVGGMVSAFTAGAVASNIAKLAKLPGGNSGKGGSGNSTADNDIYTSPKPTDKDTAKDDAVFPGTDYNQGDDSSGDSETPQRGSSYVSSGMSGDFDEQMNALMAHQAQQSPEPQPEVRSEEEQPENQPNSQGMGRGEQRINSPEADEQENVGENTDTAEPAEALATEEEQYKPSGRSSEQILADYEQRERQQRHLGQVPESQRQPTQKPIKQIAAENWDKVKGSKLAQKGKGVGKGLKAVGKKIIKPVWDPDKNAKYNFKRIGKGIGKAYLGASLGVATAAVQAGISITDGKYNPLETVTSFGAGYAGGLGIAKGMGNVVDTYRAGRDEGNKEAIMKRAQEKWSERDDVIKYNNKKYKEKEIKEVLKIQKALLAQGVTDTKEMDRCIKYIKAKNNGEIKFSENDVRRSRIIHDFYSDELTNSNAKEAIWNKDMRKDYIDSMTRGLEGEELRKKQRQLNQKFDEALIYQNANKK